MKSVEEMAGIWNVSQRHVQNMCKNGRIDGAVKKSGVWLIPESAVNPVKKKQSNNHEFEFSGTKRKIFEKSIELFKMHGFENVRTRDIADAIGIKQAAIYNHFESKQDILDKIYGFCRYYYTLDRPKLEDIEPILENGSLLDIIMSVWYEFNEDYKEKLTNAIIIVFHRLGIDERANEIAKSLIVEEGNAFAKAVFDRAVEIGRLAPLDTHAMGVLINSIRMYTLNNWLIDDSFEYTMEVDKDEQIIYKHAIKLLTDLKPPAGSGTTSLNAAL